MPESKVDQAYRKLQYLLAEMLGISPADVSRSGRFAALIPREERRRVWRELQEAGLPLPDLELSGPAFLFAAAMLLLPVGLLALLFRTWSVFLGLGNAYRLARKATRPWAIHPAHGCETIQEAVLYITPFKPEDYRAGLWPPEDIAAKVRQVIASTLGIPFDRITNEIRFIDICGC